MIEDIGNICILDDDKGDDDDGGDYHHYLGDGDEDDELNSVFELAHYDKATMMMRER